MINKYLLDSYLDIYNDYKALYEMFGDKEYLDKAGYIIRVLERTFALAMKG